MTYFIYFLMKCLGYYYYYFKFKNYSGPLFKDAV